MFRELDLGYAPAIEIVNCLAAKANGRLAVRQIVSLITYLMTS